MFDSNHCLDGSYFLMSGLLCQNDRPTLLLTACVSMGEFLFSYSLNSMHSDHQSKVIPAQHACDLNTQDLHLKNI